MVRYLELLKLAALIERPEGQSLAEAVRDVNSRILQAVTAEQREIFTSSALDDYLLDAERDARRRAAAVTARDDPSVESFLPTRGDGVVLSASDIDTYRTCPLKYKFARVFRIPQEPTIHQRFGIVVHQVLERFHGRPEEGASGSLAELLGLLDTGWRRGGFGDSEEERQLRGKAASALTRYHTRFQTEEAEPLWFERAFSFKLGPHLLRGRVDRVDRLPGGEYELIDYKTGRPKSPTQLVDDVQLSLYAVGAREAWRLESSQQAYYYLLDDQKVAVPDDREDRFEWIQEVAMEVAGGILSQGFEPTPSFAACSVCDYRLVCPAAEGRGPRCARRPWGQAGPSGPIRVPDCTGYPRAVPGSSPPRWRRKRCRSRAIDSPEGSGPSCSLISVAAACSSRSTNACTSGSLCTARLTWRS